MDHTSPVTSRIDKLIIEAGADPRGPQVAFLLPAVVLLAMVVGFTPGLLLHPFVVAGVGVLGIATAATFTVPWSRLSPWAMVAIPLLDLAGTGLLRLNPNVGAVGILLVFPAMWLGTVFRRRGVVLVALGCIAAFTIPSLLYFGTSLGGWSRGILLPVVAVFVAHRMRVSAQIWADQHARLEEQGAHLKRALQEATEQRRLGEAVIETVDVGLLLLAADGTYKSMNPRQRELIRIKNPHGHSGVAGQLGHAYAADNLTMLDAEDLPSARAARGESFSGYTIWVGDESSERHALSVSAQPIFDESGHFDGAVLAYKDITELMQASRTKDEFIASVSHELRTPLTSIIGYVDLVRESDLPDEVNGHLDVVGRNAERLLLLVSDLLGARIENGDVHRSREPTDLADVARLCVTAAAPRALAAGVEIVTTVQPLPPVMVDPDRFAQVVDNLLSNSIKYTLPGGRIEVCLEQEDDEVLLAVRDNGIGVSLQDQEQLFTRFFRAQTARQRAIPGVGLGLVITKAIVEGHGGTIEVDSREGTGTTMRVRLPLLVVSTGEPSYQATTRLETAELVRADGSSASRGDRVT